MAKPKIIGFWVGILILIISIFITLPEGMKHEATKVLNVTLLMAIWWATEYIPIYVTAFMPVVLFPFLGIIDASATSENYDHNYAMMILGGFLEVPIDLNQKFAKDEKIANIRNALGKIIKEYMAPEKGIVIGKYSFPADMGGGRIIHLGILD